MIPVIGAVLSQTRKILTKILRIDADYTTARAGHLDTIPDIDTKLGADLDAAVSTRLADSNAAARVQTGMTNQGYTAARAVKLDNLDTTPKALTTKPLVSRTGLSGTILSVSGAGILHGIRSSSGSNRTITIIIDGTTVAAPLISGLISVAVLTGYGVFEEIGGSNPGGMGSVGWTFKTSLTVSVTNSGISTDSVVYSLDS